MGKVPQSMDRPSCEAYESPDRNVRLVPSNAANQPYIDWIKRKNLVKTLAQKEVLEWSNTLKSGERTELVKETWLKNATLISGLRVLGDSSVRIFSSETRTPVILMDEQGACLLIAPLLPRKLKLTEEAAKAKKAITWQNDERLIGYFGGCKEFFEDRTQALGCRIGQKGFLMVTNHRLLFACKVGWLAKDYAITYAINFDDVVSVSHGKYGVNDKLIILERGSQHKDFIRPKIQSLIPIVNKAASQRRNELLAQQKKERVQVVLDFSSLKDVMAKGGIVMTTYKCPRCEAMVDIPEEGKVAICKYCEAQIKPVDIFERIKSLL